MTKVTIFLCLVFAFSIFFQKSDQLRTKNLISQSTMTKIVAAYFFWLLVWSILLKPSLLIFVVVVFLPLLLVEYLPFYIGQMRKSEFKKNLLCLIDSSIVKMKSGQSFRSAIRSASQELPDQTRIKVEKITEQLLFEPQEPGVVSQDTEIEAMLSFFHELEREPHLVLRRLELFREQLRVESKFNAKIKSALQQLKAQAAVLSILYSLLLTAVCFKFSFAKNSRVITASVVLFVIGSLFIMRQGKGFKWKV